MKAVTNRRSRLLPPNMQSQRSSLSLVALVALGVVVPADALPELSIRLDGNRKAAMHFTGRLLGNRRLTDPFEPVHGVFGSYDLAPQALPQFFRSVDSIVESEALANTPDGVVVWGRAKNRWIRLPGAISLRQEGIPNLPQYFSTLHTADLAGDKNLEVFARGPFGVVAWTYDIAKRKWARLPGEIPWSDELGWGQEAYYSTIQAADVAGDAKDEILARGAGGIDVWNWDLANNRWRHLPGGGMMPDAAGYGSPVYYSTIQTADITGDSKNELFCRNSRGVEMWRYDDATGAWVDLPSLPDFTDVDGWAAPEFYVTMQAADFVGDDKREVFCRSSTGLTCYQFDSAANVWVGLPSFKGLRSDQGWGLPRYYLTITTADVWGDSKAEVIARGEAGVYAIRFDPTNNAWEVLPGGIPWGDSQGWGSAAQYSTIQAADITGDGKQEILGRSTSGLEAYQRVGDDWMRLNLLDSMSDADSFGDAKFYSTIQVKDVISVEMEPGQPPCSDGTVSGTDAHWACKDGYWTLLQTSRWMCPGQPQKTIETVLFVSAEICE
ncbi:MAG TPA: hypothetical protein PLX89_10105 [Verrucomicrobiota bacterium]|nr:hypothetical protein [Verrucomicrobiales bacterium]HRI13349.1 hypothetical protein [Verrucomicrobiota bacterium]